MSIEKLIHEVDMLAAWHSGQTDSLYRISQELQNVEGSKAEIQQIKNRIRELLGEEGQTESQERQQKKVSEDTRKETVHTKTRDGFDGFHGEAID